ncbi:MAG: FadR/GntR family transcriptional regulator [Thermomicrobiales bacterium]
MAATNGRTAAAVDYQIRPLSTVSRQEEVATRIKEYIEENGLRPGDRVPGEAWFAEQLGVGRPLIREALKGLEAVGAVEARKGVGRFVGTFEAESYLRHFTTEVLIHSFSERELTEARCVLEIAAVGEAVERLTDEDLTEIRRLFESMRESAARGERNTDGDLGMHRVIMGRIDNRFFAAMLDAIYALAVARVAENYSSEKVQQDLAEHEAIMRAVVARDGPAARRALMAHFETTAQRLGFAPRWRDLFGQVGQGGQGGQAGINTDAT